jgi:hypothetical protein
MATMILTILKVVAGLAVLGIITMLLIAVVSGLRSSASALGHREDHDDDSGVG